MESARARSSLSSLLVVVVVFAAAGVGGFVYGHEPQRVALQLSIERTADEAEASREALLSGTLAEVAGSRLTLSTAQGPLLLLLPPATPIDELVALAPDELRAGMRVNVGVERAAYGLILTGVVAIESGP